jgi:hypothetical protein
MLMEDLLHGLGEIADEMPAIGDLGSGGGSRPCPGGIGGRTGARAHLDARRGLEPLRPGGGGAVREQRHGLPALEIDQHRPRGLAFPQGEIGHPEGRRGGERRHRGAAPQPQERVPAHPQVPGVAKTPPSFAAPSAAEGDQALDEPQRAPGPGRRDRGQPFREDAARAVAIAAEPLVYVAL